MPVALPVDAAADPSMTSVPNISAGLHLQATGQPRQHRCCDNMGVLVHDTTSMANTALCSVGGRKPSPSEEVTNAGVGNGVVLNPLWPRSARCRTEENCQSSVTDIGCSSVTTKQLFLFKDHSPRDKQATLKGLPGACQYYRFFSLEACLPIM